MKRTIQAMGLTAALLAGLLLGGCAGGAGSAPSLSLIHISEPTRPY